LFVAVALAALPPACAADHGSRWGHATGAGDGSGIRICDGSDELRLACVMAGGGDVSQGEEMMSELGWTSGSGHRTKARFSG